MTKDLDPKRNIPPEIDDPELAALAEQFMTGEMPRREKSGHRTAFVRSVGVKGKANKSDYRGLGTNRR